MLYIISLSLDKYLASEHHLKRFNSIEPSKSMNFEALILV